MILLGVPALLASAATGAAFTARWLVVVAVASCLLWLISALAGAVGGRQHGARW
jgi:predicted branched-subunit amino acid permease